MEEIKTFEKNRIWDITELPKRKLLIDYKWVFIIKYKTDGTIEQYKACLVTNGFTQTHRVDYTKIFTPVVKLNTMGVFLSLVASLIDLYQKCLPK